MAGAGPRLDRLVTGIRWAARVLGALLVILVVVIAVGESISQGMLNPLDLTWSESLLFVAFIVMLLGIIAAWRWDGIGGAVVVVGFIGFWLINFASSQRLWMGWVFALFLLVGVMHLFCWWRSRYQSTA